IKPNYILPQIIELRTTLTERIHLACQEVEQRIIAILAAKIKYSVVLIVIVLDVPASDEIHAKSELVLAAQNIHIVRHLEARNRKFPERARSAAHGESAVAYRYLQEIVGTLIEVLDSQFSGIDSVRVWSTI